MQPERKNVQGGRPHLEPQGQPGRMAPPDQIDPEDPDAGAGLTQGYVPKEEEDDSGEADLTTDLPLENTRENEEGPVTPRRPR